MGTVFPQGIIDPFFVGTTNNTPGHDDLFHLVFLEE
jgi:hypothetical protein